MVTTCYATLVWDHHSQPAMFWLWAKVEGIRLKTCSILWDWKISFSYIKILSLFSPLFHSQDGHKPFSWQKQGRWAGAKGKEQNSSNPICSDHGCHLGKAIAFLPPESRDVATGFPRCGNSFQLSTQQRIITFRWRRTVGWKCKNWGVEVISKGSHEVSYSWVIGHVFNIIGSQQNGKGCLSIFQMTMG